MSKLLLTVGVLLATGTFGFANAGVSGTESAKAAECCCGDNCTCDKCGCADGTCVDCDCEACGCDDCNCGKDCGK